MADKLLFTAAREPEGRRLFSFGDLQQSFDRIRSIIENLGVIALNTDLSRQLASDQLTTFYLIENHPEIVTRSPAQIILRAPAHVNALNVGEHSETACGIRCL